jgi:hypothetical protein
MLFHPRIDGGIPLYSPVKSQQFRSHRRSSSSRLVSIGVRRNLKPQMARRGDRATGRWGDGCSTPKSHIIDASLKRRARLLITNSSIPRQTRSLIRYALEIKDPYLAQVVRRVEAGEMTIERLYLE